MRVERAQHARDRGFCYFVEVNLPGKIVFRDDNGACEVFSNSRPGRQLGRALTLRALSGMSAGEGEWQNKRQDQQPVPLLKLPLGPLNVWLHQSLKTENAP